MYDLRVKINKSIYILKTYIILFIIVQYYFLIRQSKHFKRIFGVHRPYFYSTKTIDATIKTSIVVIW